MKDAMKKIENLTYGCELEYMGIDQARAAKAVARVVGGTARYVGAHLNNWEVEQPDGRKWQIVSDASVPGGSETVTPILTYRDMTILQEVIRALRHEGAKVDYHTGLHIHVGAKDMTPKQIQNLVKVFYKNEKLILKAAGTQQARINRYTKETDHAFLRKIEKLHGTAVTMRSINEAWFGCYTPCSYHYDNHRYHALNLNNLWNCRDYTGNTHSAKHTVEFRFFEGTTHAGKVRANVLLALTLVAFATEAKGANAAQREYNPTSAKFDFRCFLLRLGWIGDEFKEPRKHLLANLTGSAAWKDGAAHGRRAA